MNLFVSGGRHVHRDSPKRKEEIIQALGGQPDVVLIEGSTEPDDDSEKFRNLLAAPLIVLSLFAYSLFLKSIKFLLSSDQELVESVAGDRKVDKVKVDRPITPMISEGRVLWAVANWIVLIIFVLFFVANGLSSALTFLIIFSTVIFVSFIAGTAAPRNYAMAINTLQVAKDNGYDRAVLVVGNEHAEEVTNHIRSASNDIEIVESHQ